MVRQFAKVDIDYAVVTKYLFSEEIIDGLIGTIVPTVTVMLFGLALGIVVALMRRSENPLLRWSGAAWVWFFRGVPALVLLLTASTSLWS